MNLANQYGRHEVCFIITLFINAWWIRINVLWSGVSIRWNFMTYPHFHLFLVNCYSLTPKFSRRASLTCFAFARLVIDTPWSIGTTLAICYTQTRHSIGVNAFKWFVMATSPAFRLEYLYVRLSVPAVMKAKSHPNVIASSMQNTMKLWHPYPSEVHICDLNLAK